MEISIAIWPYFLLVVYLPEVEIILTHQFIDKSLLWEEVKLCADDTILYIENTKESTIWLWEQMNKSSKVVGYEIDTQKPIIILYTSNKQSASEIKKQFHV